PAVRPASRPAARVVGGAGAPVAVARGDGALRPVEGSGRRRGSGPLQRYTVAVEGGLGIDARAFAGTVEATLADPRSWGAGGRLSFQRVDAGPVAFRVVLASPDTTDWLCAPLRTAGTYSCASRGSAVVNAGRWLRGAAAYRGELVAYRQYVVNHEVGHVLGHGHESCPGAGRPAPVMVQQTKGVGACRPNAWPFP
ncbi:MAG: DUF3152 domain-containing protein, partial [Actinomycetota bacterium]|nr:DUF3152 domain-containing protein [Actinomycetota bacterium]